MWRCDTHTHTDTQTHTQTQTHTDTHRHRQTHTHTHSHISTHTHTHTHTSPAYHYFPVRGGEAPHKIFFPFLPLFFFRENFPWLFRPTLFLPFLDFASFCIKLKQRWTAAELPKVSLTLFEIPPECSWHRRYRGGGTFSKKYPLEYEGNMVWTVPMVQCLNFRENREKNSEN